MFTSQKLITALIPLFNKLIKIPTLNIKSYTSKSIVLSFRHTGLNLQNIFLLYDIKRSLWNFDLSFLSFSLLSRFIANKILVKTFQSLFSNVIQFLQKVNHLIDFDDVTVTRHNHVYELINKNNLVKKMTCDN